jgi:hypothetical protein
MKVELNPTLAIDLYREGKLREPIYFDQLVEENDDNAIMYWIQNDMPINEHNLNGSDYLYTLLQNCNILSINLIINHYIYNNECFTGTEYIPILLVLYAKGMTELKELIDISIKRESKIMGCSPRVLIRYSLVSTKFEAYHPDYVTDDILKSVAKGMYKVSSNSIGYRDLEIPHAKLTLKAHHLVIMDCISNLIILGFPFDKAVELFDLKFTSTRKPHIIYEPSRGTLDLKLSKNSKGGVLSRGPNKNFKVTNYIFKDI